MNATLDPIHVESISRKHELSLLDPRKTRIATTMLPRVGT